MEKKGRNRFHDVTLIVPIQLKGIVQRSFSISSNDVRVRPSCKKQADVWRVIHLEGCDEWTPSLCVSRVDVGSELEKKQDGFLVVMLTGSVQRSVSRLYVQVAQTPLL